MRVEAWAPNPETCIAEAVLGTVAAFLDTASAAADGSRRSRLSGSSDEDLPVAVLDEAIFLMDTVQQVPIDLEIQPLDANIDVGFDVVSLGVLQQVGGTPKGVSLCELPVGPERRGGSCM